MQDIEKSHRFKQAVGKVIRRIRTTNTNLSMSKFANEYDFYKSNVSKIEKGLYNIQLITAWRISEALGIKFVDFAKLLQEELGEDFTFIDE